MIAAADRSEMSPSERERRLEDAIAEYKIAVEAGRPPDRSRFLERYPDLAPIWRRSLLMRTASGG